MKLPINTPPDPTGRLDLLAVRFSRLFVSRLPVNQRVYDQLVAPVVEECITRSIPSEPITIVDICDRIGLLPAKRGRK